MPGNFLEGGLSKKEFAQGSIGDCLGLIIQKKLAVGCLQGKDGDGVIFLGNMSRKMLRGTCEGNFTGGVDNFLGEFDRKGNTSGTVWKKLSVRFCRGMFAGKSLNMIFMGQFVRGKC